MCDDHTQIRSLIVTTENPNSEMVTDDRWRTVALADDTMVAELLLRLKHSTWDYSSTATPNPQPQLQYRSLLQLPVGWGHRQPRSKPATVTPTTITSCSKKEREPATATRCSPTTPLSWSDASTSEESSLPSDLHPGGRSKAVFPTDNATSKKSRKRKTFVELKGEEGFLLNEMTHLKKELASMQVTFKQQIARSANLKRLKHGLHIGSGNNVERRFGYQLNQTEAPSSSFNRSHSGHDYEGQETGFVVPDLNMAPTEEETEPAENLYGMR